MSNPLSLNARLCSCLIAGIILLCAYTPQAQAGGFGWSKGFVRPGVANTAQSVNAMAWFDDGSGFATYIGGDFNSIGGLTSSGLDVPFLVRWDGSKLSPVGPRLNNGVKALAVFDDGNGPALYAAGAFTMIGSQPANRIAKWDGQNWTPLGSGIEGMVQCLHVHDDGTGPALYAGGTFLTAGGVFCGNIAKWDGSSWSGLQLGTNNAVWTLESFDDGAGNALYVGGTFTQTSGNVANGLAKWNGSAWSSVGGGANNAVFALRTFDDGSGERLYVGGNFTQLGGQPMNRLGAWNGSTWDKVGGGLTGGSQPLVYALEVYDDGTQSGDTLFVGGRFEQAGGVPCKYVARWNGAAWSAIGGDIDGVGVDFPAVRVLLGVDDGNGPSLFVGGGFLSAGGVRCSNLARWNGASWSAVGALSWVDNYVRALAVYDDGTPAGEELYVGGDFINIGSTHSTIQANYIAKWDGTIWKPLGPGLGNRVRCLRVFDLGQGPKLYAGGDFSTSGGQFLGNVGIWDGATWAGLAGINGFIHDMAVVQEKSGPALYVAGQFATTLEGVTVNNIAKWNGSVFEAVGTGTNNIVNTLAAFDDDGPGPHPEALYVGGSFSHAGGVLVNRLAKWDGTTWMPVGGGVAGPPGPIVHAIKVFDDGSGPALFVGGLFGAVNGSTCRGFAKFNGSTWQCLAGTETTAVVRTMSRFHDGVSAKLAVGGQFESIAGIAANYLAVWDGTTFHSLQGGVGPFPTFVHALAEYNGFGGQSLYAGGEFIQANGFPCSYLAAWTNEKGPQMSQQPQAITQPKGESAHFTANVDGGVPLMYQWRRNGVNLANGNGVLGAASGFLEIADIGQDDVGSYDVVIGNIVGSSISDSATLVIGAVCGADIAPFGGNGMVNVDDLLAIINAWGPCGNPANCPADIAPAGGNDVVNVDDLLAVINGWGPCP